MKLYVTSSFFAPKLTVIKSVVLMKSSYKTGAKA